MLNKIKELYNAISNRFLAIIILISTIFIAFYFLNKKEVKLTYEIDKILEKKEDNEIQDNKKEKIKIVKQNKVINKNINKEEQRKKLKASLNSDKYKKIFNKKEFYSKKNGDKIFIFINKKEILSFDKKENTEVLLDEIKGTSNEVYIFFNNKIFLYNLDSKNLSKINFGIIPKYLKKISDENYLIVTQKGSFIYNYYNKKINYFYLFKDFIIYNNNYIGIIFESEKNKKRNLGLENFSSNILVKYNLKTKKREVILKNINNFDKILKENNKIYIYYNKEKYLLEGF